MLFRSRHQNRKVWLDFKYERLPFFCYSCGKIGHYANYCKDFPYDEGKFTIEFGSCFGSWLKAETTGHSPFWKVFYKKDSMVEEIEENIPTTPENQRQNAVMGDIQPIPLTFNSNIQQGDQMRTNHYYTQEITLYNFDKRALLLIGPTHEKGLNSQSAQTKIGRAHV